MRYITVVPAIRTVPGVEQFDYAIPDEWAVQAGDVIHISFRNREQAALVIQTSSTSAFAHKAILIRDQRILLRCGEVLPKLLHQAAKHTLTSQPTILAAWLRRVPHRASVMPTTSHSVTSTQARLPMRQIRFLGDRWRGKNGLLEETRRHSGHVLILTPWRHRAQHLSKLLETSVLHSDVADGAAWRAVYNFTTHDSSSLVTTRVGAWLASLADTILIDEPENDDYKQDEMTPRLDARWLVECCANLRPEMSVIQLSTTPRLRSALTSSVPHTQNIFTTTPSVMLAKTATQHMEVTLEAWHKRSGSAVEMLSPQTINLIEETLEAGQSVTILHPILGERARLTCHDCGWQATCAACQFPLSHVDNMALCKRCGRRSELPLICSACGGSDLTRGLPGKERLAKQCTTYFKTANVQVVDIMELDAWQLNQLERSVGVTPDLSRRNMLVITDLALLSGASEDIRLKERLILTWRRLAAGVAAEAGRLVVQGQEELIADCQAWLTSTGLNTAWQQELAERRLFGFPPAVHLVKLLVAASDQIAQHVVQSLRADVPQTWQVNGPYSVAFRAHTRRPRQAMHVLIPSEVAETTLETFFSSYSDQAIIDLDPVAFFS